ncbi:unnamed protein product [Orchesella dallaii]|uniref:C2H2-type domain-containing protein n=1 Tax=Orchesella dallaii TaxID=48710 RepID=A0ABP1PNH2_9HEXA
MDFSKQDQDVKESTPPPDPTAKLVGARKRKPVNISKISSSIVKCEPHASSVSVQDHESEEETDDEYYGRSPPTSEPNNNKIQSILSELKFAKQRNHVTPSPQQRATIPHLNISPKQFNNTPKHKINNNPLIKHFGGGFVLQEDKSKENEMSVRVMAHQPRLTSLPLTRFTPSNPSFQDEPLDLSVDAVDLRKNQEQQNVLRMMMMMGDEKRFKNPNLPSPPPSPPINIPMDLTSSGSRNLHVASPKIKLEQSMNEFNDRVSSSFGSPPSSIGSNNASIQETEKITRKYQKRRNEEKNKDHAHRVHNQTIPGVKPKQRRYRTERPFHCPHCPARFTLRSNMERHGKHQHASVWQRSPSNRVLNKQRALQAQASGSTPPPPSSHSNSSSNANTPAPEPPNPNIRLVLSQQLKRKLSNLEQADLASVETLLEKTGNEDFRKYFHSVAGEFDEEDDVSMDEDQQANEDDAIDEYDDERFKEDYYDEEECDTDDPSKRNLRSRNKPDKVQNVQKSLSAYSSAPHKVFY